MIVFQRREDRHTGRTPSARGQAGQHSGHTKREANVGRNQGVLGHGNNTMDEAGLTPG